MILLSMGSKCYNCRKATPLLCSWIKSGDLDGKGYKKKSNSFVVDGFITVITECPDFIEGNLPGLRSCSLDKEKDKKTLFEKIIEIDDSNKLLEILNKINYTELKGSEFQAISLKFFGKEGSLGTRKSMYYGLIKRLNKLNDKKEVVWIGV